MNVVFTGSLRYQLQLSEVLRRIMESPALGLTALLLLDEENGRRGHIYISNSLYVCGADLTSEDGTVSTGYEALKILCSLVLADFKYIEGAFEDADVSLNIEIPQIIRLAPRLPAEPPGVQNESALLDRIFSPDSPETTIEPNSNLKSPFHANAVKPFTQSLKDKTDWHAIVQSKKPPKKEKEKVRYTSLEERAFAEIDPLTLSPKPPRRKNFIEKIVDKIKFSILSTVTAFGTLFKSLAIPVLVPALIIFVCYEVYNLVGSKALHWPQFQFQFPGAKQHGGRHSR